MKASQVLVALFLSALLVTSHAGSTLTATAYSSGTTDDSTQYPATITGTGASITSITSKTTAPVITTGSTLSFTFAKTAVIAIFTHGNLGESAGAPAAIAALINYNVGNQVAVTVSAASVSTPQAAAPAVTLGSGATAGTPTATSTTCGVYSLDCAAGTVSFSIYVAAGTTTTTTSTWCVVQVNQYSAIVGVLAYPTASAPASPYAAVTAAVTSANTATSPSTVVCGTSVSGTNTLLYFISTYGTTTVTADQTTAFNAVKTAAMKQGIASNTQYYVAQLPTSAAGLTTAPSASASANLATASKSSNKVIVVAGIATTVFASVFGFAL